MEAKEVFLFPFPRVHTTILLLLSTNNKLFFSMAFIPLEGSAYSTTELASFFPPCLNSECSITRDEAVTCLMYE